jgi:hypothetical protein
MTLKSFGRALRIHMHMLSLVGYEFNGIDMQPATELDTRKRAMVAGLHSLHQSTQADFGYDATAWREFLIKSGNSFGYTHPYAYNSVDKAVQAALADPDVLATLKLLDQENKIKYF